MYYKLKSVGKGFRLLGTVDKKNFDDGFLYLTQDELDLLKPETIEGYTPIKSEVNTTLELYRNLNKA